MPRLSVVICAHNPRTEYLQRALDSLKQQSLGQAHWELLVVDNNSTIPLTGVFELSWHSESRVVREEMLGLTRARLCGIRESRGEILVFVDDDNLLAANYLERTLEIADAWPELGAWSGQCHPEFEETPEEWTRPYWAWLAIREFSDDRWSNQREASAAPWGAGMCIRRECAVAYHRCVQGDLGRIDLDRRGDNLISGGDTDMVMQVWEMDYGTGVFAGLELTHLIPRARLTEDYLVRFAESSMYTKVTLDALYDRVQQQSVARRLVNWIRRIIAPRRERRFRLAQARGEAAARRHLVVKRRTIQNQ